MMNKISERIRNNSDLIENALKTYLSEISSGNKEFDDVIKYAVLDGGKRIRPTLVLEFCRLYGGEDEAAIPLACAVEFIHCYSLIHDDLPCMDNDDYRRGKLSCHKKYGEAKALLAGDALLALALEIITENKFLAPELIVEAVRFLSKCAGVCGMVGGQVFDMESGLDYETMILMNNLKTGKMFAASCVLGCIAAGKTDYQPAIDYAAGIGLAFQITDDIMDDGTDGEKSTFLTFMDKEAAQNLSQKLTDEACTAISNVEGNDILCGIARYMQIRKN